ncbi:hypothetical protein [Pedobacter sp. NJ-S-72]
MQKELNIWLNGDQDYHTGVKLLQQYRCSNFLIQLLSSGPDVYNTPKLHSEILKARNEVENQPAVISPAQSLTIPTHYKPDRNLEKKMRIDAIIVQLWKEICHLHGQLSVLPEGERLYECANSIMVKDLKRQDLWDQLHYYKLNGVWFDELQENMPKPFNLEQDIKNLMTSRSKAKKMLKKPLPDAKRIYYQGRVSHFDKKIEDLKKLRNNGQ